MLLTWERPPWVYDPSQIPFQPPQICHHLPKPLHICNVYLTSLTSSQCAPTQMQSQTGVRKNIRNCISLVLKKFGMVHIHISKEYFWQYTMVCHVRIFMHKNKTIKYKITKMNGICILYLSHLFFIPVEYVMVLKIVTWYNVANEDGGNAETCLYEVYLVIHITWYLIHTNYHENLTKFSNNIIYTEKIRQNICKVSVSNTGHYKELLIIPPHLEFPYLVNFTSIINGDLQKIELCKELNSWISS